MNDPQSRFGLKIVVPLILAIIVFIVIVASLINPFISRSAPLQISAGSKEGKRHEIAKTLVAIARNKGLNIADPIGTEGSIKTIKLVTEGKLDLGLIQGGLLKYLDDPELRSRLENNFIEKTELLNMRQIDTLDVEPLHLLFKPSIIKEGVMRIEDLRGRKKRLNLSEKGSGTQLLALQILRLVRLMPEKDYIEENLSYEQLKTLTYDNLPDVVFTISLLRSPVALYLIENHGYELIEVPYGKSLSIDNTGIKTSVIDKYIYGSHQTKSIETIGTTLLLVTNAGVSDDGIERLLETSRDVEFNTIVNRISIPEQSPEYPLHPGVGKFASKNDPILTRELLRNKYTINGFLILILVVLIANLRHAWSTRKSEQEHLKQIEAYSAYRKEVSDVERELDKLRDETPDDYSTRLERLRKNLIEIRDRVNNDLYKAESVDRSISDTFQRYINSVISSVENLLGATKNR